MLPIRRILHPTDFSDSSRAAFELACALARDYSAALVVAHVVPPTRVFAPDGIAVPLPAEEEYDQRAKLARLHPTDTQIEVDHRLVEGDPAEMILKLAKDTGADVIVMGTHGTTGLTRLLVGSVAESVLRKAPCPVLTVRGPFRIAPSASAAAPNETEAAPTA
jgi:nucleotide-binding universal stress UspA family protein